MFEKLNQNLDKSAAMGIPSYDCIVYKDGREIYRRMYGYSDIEKTTPINGTEKYNIYSASKIITVTAALTLFEKGYFKLDDPLYEYMPEFKDMTVNDGGIVRAAGNIITVKDLFAMTAGLSYDLNSDGVNAAKRDTEGRCPLRETVKYIAKDPLLFEPGTRFHYSFCHDVLAALVEVLTGEGFGKYVRKIIFEPCGMSESSFLPSDDEIEALAAQYIYDAESKVFKDRGKRNHYRLGSEYESGGAGCISTVKDYINFLEALRKGALVSEKTLDLMSTGILNDIQIKDFDKKFKIVNMGYTYGLGVRCPMKCGAPFDFGWSGAAGALAVCDRKNGLSVFYVQHVLNTPNKIHRYGMPGAVLEDLGLR